MTLYELNHDQIVELKQHYLTDRNPSISWGELANADDLVSMAQLEIEYIGYNFVPEDFSSSAE